MIQNVKWKGGRLNLFILNLLKMIVFKDSLVNWKNTKMRIFLYKLLQLFLKYAYMLLIGMEFSNCILPIHLNCWKTILSMNLM